MIEAFIRLLRRISTDLFAKSESELALDARREWLILEFWLYGRR